MTATAESATREPTTRAQALALIDGKLGEIGMRELVSRTEFTNLLLDLRLLLCADPEAVSVN
jgi:hypothetical protein